MRKTRAHRWYLDIMSPNTKGKRFAWLDPTSIYINGDAYIALLNDLTSELKEIKFDVVAGIDAMGFVLGAAIATRLGVGFLPIRKEGKLCVKTDSVSFVNYSGRRQKMEMRKPAFDSGTRVLIVDQWVETGGTMEAAISLVKRQEGKVVGITAIAMEENKRTENIRANYPVITAVLPGTKYQKQCNFQHLQSFAEFKPEMAFPKRTSKN